MRVKCKSREVRLKHRLVGEWISPVGLGCSEPLGLLLSLLVLLRLLRVIVELSLLRLGLPLGARLATSLFWADHHYRRALLLTYPLESLVVAKVVNSVYVLGLLRTKAALYLSFQELAALPPVALLLWSRTADCLLVQ
jgi:hypothetical protein